MRSDFGTSVRALCAAVSLAVPALAAGTAGDVFSQNQASVLSNAVSVVGDFVFSVGKAVSTPKTTDEVGFAKANMSAYENLDRLNFDAAPWPRDLPHDERAFVWTLYRAFHPYAWTLTGGERVYRTKTGPAHFLSVLAFRRAQVLQPPVSSNELAVAIAEYRHLRAAVEAELTQKRSTSSLSPETP